MSDCQVERVIFFKTVQGDVKFRILMLYNHDVIRLQQKPNISSTRFSGLPTLVTEHAWYCGMSRYINFRLTQTSGFNTLQGRHLIFRSVMPLR